MEDNNFLISGARINPGENRTLEISTANLYTQTPIKIPVHVINGKKPGPKLFVIAGIHGNEINGVEIIRRLLRSSSFKRLKGTIVAVPIVNVYGFISLSRYLPDRRDLNRSFPGSEKGSMASRLANLLIKEVINQCDYGIDLHTGAIHRSNLPHVRVNLDLESNINLAKAFNTPVILDSKIRDGSLRQACTDLGIPVLVYEGGEALRFDEFAIRAGVKGIRGIMNYLDMLSYSSRKNKKCIIPMISRSSRWIRAHDSGIIHAFKNLGETVNKGDSLGIIVDPFGTDETPIISTVDGIIIGKSNLPLANEGDALFHIAQFKELDIVASQVNDFENIEPYISGPLFDYESKP